MRYKPYAPIIIVLAGIFLLACGSNNSQNQTADAGNWDGFEMSAVTGSDNQRAIKRDESLRVTEEGFVLNGNKNGAWITYHPEGRIQTIENFIDDRVEGLSLEYDKRGQMIKKSFFYDGEFHGDHTTFKFGRAQESIPYTHGVINGTVKRYYNNGRVMEEIDFKAGIQHGFYKHYNADEKLDMSYEYKNGEKVSGGMVDPDSNE